ncbi:MAG: hypothetical protein IPP51_10100 [Bacteroidetes bacterium]|nr:hypothetical protein [Bacteroidota bacterium]
MKTIYTICVLFFVLFASLESKAIQTTTEQTTINTSEILPADEFTSAYYSKSENSINLIYHISANSDTRIRVYEITGKIVKDIHLPVQGAVLTANLSTGNF